MITKFAASVLNTSRPTCLGFPTTSKPASGLGGYGDARYDYYASQSVMVWAAMMTASPPLDPNSISAPGGIGILPAEIAGSGPHVDHHPDFGSTARHPKTEPARFCTNRRTEHEPVSMGSPAPGRSQYRRWPE